MKVLDRKLIYPESNIRRFKDGIKFKKHICYSFSSPNAPNTAEKKLFNETETQLNQENDLLEEAIEDQDDVLEEPQKITKKSTQRSHC